MSSLASGLLQTEEGRAALDRSERRTTVNKIKKMLVTGPFALKSVCFVACAACLTVNVLSAISFVLHFGKEVKNKTKCILLFVLPSERHTLICTVANVCLV